MAFSISNDWNFEEDSATPSFSVDDNSLFGLPAVTMEDEDSQDEAVWAGFWTNGEEKRENFDSLKEQKGGAFFPTTERRAYQVDPNWEHVFGNIFTHKFSSEQHICDFNCANTVFSTNLGFYVCSITGKPSRVYSSSDKLNKRAVEADNSAEAKKAMRTRRRRHCGGF